MMTKSILAAAVLGFVGAPSLLAFDYFVDTSTKSLALTTWSFNHVLKGLNDYNLANPTATHTLADIDSITISWTIEDNIIYAYDNNDPGAGINPLTYTLGDSIDLTLPGTLGLKNQSLSKTANAVITADDGDLGGPFTGTDSVTDTDAQNKTATYSVPSGDFSIFAAGVSVPAVATSSNTQNGTGNEQIGGLNKAGSSVTITFVFVPEANSLAVVLPGLGLVGCGLFLRRNGR